MMSLKIGLFDRIFLGRTDPEDDKNGDIEQVVKERSRDDPEYALLNKKQEEE